MFRRYRQRRGPYALATPSPVPSFIRSGILLLIALVVLYYIGRGILGLFGLIGNTERTPVQLSVENRGAVNVSLEGGPMQRADDTLKLYAGDTVSAQSNSHARLTFFDTSWIRTDTDTDVSIVTSADTKDEEAFEVELTKGALWVNTPKLSSYSGTVMRTIVLPAFSLSLPSDTQAAVDGRHITVFNADGNGIAITMKDAKEPIFLGEGQQLTLPENPTGDLFQYRSAIDPLAAQKTFITESRALGRSVTVTSGSGSTALLDPNSLALTSPKDNASVTTGTVTVAGKIGSKVDRVRVNGYMANIDRAQHSFSEELTTSDGAQMSIHIEALDVNGIVIDEVTRTVKIIKTNADAPQILSPAKNGQTYRTQKTQLEIKGTASSKVASVYVNDYKLQLFRKGDTSWSYLASSALNNLLSGKNMFTVYTLDDAGNRSASATLTVIVEAGVEGVVSTGSTVAAPEQVEEKTLPQNAPLTPNVITVTGPAAGSSFTATGSEILLEGTTSAQTDSIWINGYKLRLFKSGNTTWNYIASVAFTTLKKGTNVYTIHARNKNNELLDSFVYTVSYNP